MFIRESSKTAKGKKYVQHQLIRSVRTPAGPRQRVELNLGVLDVPREKWKELANAIESYIHNQPSLFLTDPNIDSLAQHYANMIIRRRIQEDEERHEGAEEPEREKRDLVTVDVNSERKSDMRTVGPEHVALQQMTRYQLGRILRGCGFDRRQIALAKMLVAGRMVHPASERETARWLNESSALCELLGMEQKVNDNALHRVANLLWEQHDRVEQQLAQAAREAFDLDDTILLYDLTNTYFESNKKNSQIARRKKSKDARHDRPLITLALTIDSEGFAKRSRILAGNISEPGTLEEVLDQVKEPESDLFQKKTIVIDAGIASEENLERIQAKGFHYLAVSRKKTFGDAFWEDGTEEDVVLANGKSVLKTKLTKMDGEAFLRCHSPEKEEKERSILHRRLSKFEEGLTTLDAGLRKKRTRKGYDQILERIGRLKEKYGVGTLYEITVSRNGDLATAIAFDKNEKGKVKEQHVGEYILRTDRCDLTHEEISKIHRSLTIVENSFRSMKSELGIRPNHHKRDDPSVAHIFITVIAYHIVTGVLKTLRAQGIRYTWATIRKLLLNHSRSTSTLTTAEGDSLNIRSSTSPTLRQSEIYLALGIPHQPLRRKTARIPRKGS
ncbi:MAG: IS1634 family transposase [Planctomycetota bacterium]|jgi:transposase